VSHSFKLGQGKTSPDPATTVRSGWDVDKIQKFRTDAGECEKPAWIDVGKTNEHYWEDETWI
jgi:hypothetical protein